MWNIENQLFDDFDDSATFAGTAVVANPGLVDNASLVDVTPLVSGAAYQDVDTVAADGFFTQTTFKGAFGSDNWLDGWSALSDVMMEMNCIAGDFNGDGVVNVVDVVQMVSVILENNLGYNECADINNDGVLNVVDAVNVVNIILGTREKANVGNDATEAKIIINNNSIAIESNGLVQGLQMVLSHKGDFSIDLADTYVANYVTKDNITSLVIVTDGSTSITDVATFEGDNVKIESSFAVNSSASEVAIEDIEVVADFELKLAGPNPFNPSTNLEIVIAEAGFVSVNVYNVLGQKVATLVNGYMEASAGHSITWNAGNLASGVYIVQAVAAGDIATQKVMLIK